MPASEFKFMGLSEDFKRRQELKRIDDQQHCDLIRKARSVIYDEGRAVTSKKVEELLRPHSYVPTNNGFSRRLRYLGFDVFESLTVDLLHEFELGVWKSVFQHLLRILHTHSSSSVTTLNQRFRLIPSFGDGTIRPFSEDVSDLKRPAARTYEDILQCMIPAIEGLLPPAIEAQVLTLLFVLAEWHGLAKLRRHTSMSVDALRHTTTRLGHELRDFHHYTSNLEVYETPKEQSARQQRTRKKAKPRAALATDLDPTEPMLTLEPSRQRKYFNLETIKFHVLGDYPEQIVGELLHRCSKQGYARTNGRDYLPQIGKIQQIQTRLNDIQTNLDATSNVHQSMDASASTPAPAEELPAVDGGRSPYQIAASQKCPVILPLWLRDHCSDPAVKDFYPRLKAHFLARLSGGQYQDEQHRRTSELSCITLQYDRIYAHQTLQIRYTTYDMRRAQDTINPNTPKRFVLLPSHEAQHPDMGARRFWYAKVLGIYYANVSHMGSCPKRVDFLWVRWLGRRTDMPGGESCRPDQVGYFEDSESFHAFDFVDPIDVIRAAHLIPQFVGKQTTEYLQSVDSLAADVKHVGDWKHYYINRFADRDMLLRFMGMAIGHKTVERGPSGQVTPAFDSGYEYTEYSEPAVQDKGDEINDEDSPSEEEEEEESEDESDFEQIREEQVDDGDVDGVSW
ncbi:hypothetical protein FS749_004614 [Ceratobasidium sp. UAMH 11750]|nr:hypothetical protein FS749_004614 [Ceratobasidium sp. UAMH 11750]